jgi:Holliday junction DNA helicase RuvB
MSKTVEEFLYPAMENFKIDFIVDKGPYAKTIHFNLKPFTLIGATTRSGLLATPMRDRFGIFYHFDFYQPKDLARIVTASAGKLGITIDQDAALAIAQRARGTPRIANRLLRRCRDYAQVSAQDQIDIMVIQQAMQALSIDHYGLDDLDRRLLNILLSQYDGGPVGIEALAATLNEEVDTLIDVVEPYLLKAGFLKRTSRGREITMLGREHVKKI